MFWEAAHEDDLNAEAERMLTMLEVGLILDVQFAMSTSRCCYLDVLKLGCDRSSLVLMIKSRVCVVGICQFY